MENKISRTLRFLTIYIVGIIGTGIALGFSLTSLVTLEFAEMLFNFTVTFFLSWALFKFILK